MATNVDDLVQVYAGTIFKTTEHDDGTLTIYGKAAGPDLDLDQQICDPAFLKAELGSWYSKWGNIRESHDPRRAVGIATEYEPKNDEHFISARIVDPLTVAKCKSGVLKGLSLGIKSPRIIKDKDAPGGRIVAGRVVEVSCVDHPANTSCSFTVMKAVGAENALVPVVEEDQADLDKGTHGSNDARVSAGLNADLAKLADVGLAKGSDAEDRDEHGRWTAGGSGGDDGSDDEDGDEEPKDKKKPGVFARVRRAVHDFGEGGDVPGPGNPHSPELMRAKQREADADITKDASGHSHTHGHADGNHAHAHTHESSNYDHGDGEPHAHEHDEGDPSLTDAPADDSRSAAEATDAGPEEKAQADEETEDARPTGERDSDPRDGDSSSEDEDEDAKGEGSDPDPDEEDRGTPVAYEGEGVDSEDSEDDPKKKKAKKAAEPEAGKDEEDDHALPDGSYSIRNVHDLRSAVELAQSGHGDVGAARPLIKARAKDLGREDLVPDAWKAADAFRRIMGADAADLVEELRARFGDKAVAPELIKAGEAEGIASARRALASLVMDEAAEMFAGQEDETACMDALLDSLKALRLFEMLEHTEDEVDAPSGSDETAALAAPEVEMATAADLVKMLTGDDTESATARDDIVKALGMDAEGIKAAVTEKILSDIEATKAAAQEGIKALEERLSQVEEMAAPGGPSRTRRPADAAKAANADRLRTEAANYRNLAAAALDAKLREGYQALAADASEKLASIEA